MINAANLAYVSNDALRSYSANMQGVLGSNVMNRVAQTYDIKVLDLVKLRTPVPDSGRTLPAGSIGTVVYRYLGSYDYEVEFSHPFHAVVYVENWQVAAV